MLHEIEDGQLRALQPAGRDVRGQHAARAIQHEDDVLAERLAAFRLLAPLRPRQRQADAGHGQHEQPVLEAGAGPDCASAVSSARKCGAASCASCLRRAQAEYRCKATKRHRPEHRQPQPAAVRQNEDGRMFMAPAGSRVFGQHQFQGQQAERRQQRPLEQAACRS